MDCAADSSCEVLVDSGGEANVAVALANYGLDARFVTALPANPIGDWALSNLRRFGVDTSAILRQEGGSTIIGFSSSR